MLTAAAIFIIVALTFKNLALPAILVLIVQCGVYIAVSVVGIQGMKLYYLALLMVECISEICGNISIGAFSAAMLILFILPGVLATMDKFIKRKKFEFPHFPRHLKIMKLKKRKND